MQPPVPGRHRPGLNRGLNEDQRKEIKQLFETAKQQYAERDLRSLEDTLRRIIEIDPRASRAYHLLGTVYLERKEEESAFRIFSEAVNLFPQDPMLRYDLGALYYKRELYDLARQELSKALEIAPHFPKAQQTRQLLLSLQHPGQMIPFQDLPLPQANSDPDSLSPQPPATDSHGPGDSLQKEMIHDPTLEEPVGQ
jgi:tetratricopeptide (TPR) repeat protein